MTLTMPIDPLARRICDIYAMPPSINGIRIVEPPEPEPKEKVVAVAKPPKPQKSRRPAQLTYDELEIERVQRLTDVEVALDVAPRCADLAERVGRITRLSPADICGPLRYPAYVNARAAIAYVLRQRTTMSLPQIGRIMGRDHSTVIHMVKIAKARIAQCPDYRRFVVALGGTVEAEQ